MATSFTFKLASTEFVEDVERVERPARFRHWRTTLAATVIGMFATLETVARSIAIIPSDLRIRGGTFLAFFLTVAAVLSVYALRKAVADRANRAHPLRVTIDDSGVTAEHRAGEVRKHPWTSLTTVQAKFGGVLLDFGDRAAYWIPRSVFASRRQRAEFIAFATERASHT